MRYEDLKHEPAWSQLTGAEKRYLRENLNNPKHEKRVGNILAHANQKALASQKARAALRGEVVLPPLVIMINLGGYELKATFERAGKVTLEGDLRFPGSEQHCQTVLHRTGKTWDLRPDSVRGTAEDFLEREFRAWAATHPNLIAIADDVGRGLA